MDLVSQNLKRRTTYREYILKFLADERGELPERFRGQVEEREAEIAARMKPGDELWEFEYGEWNTLSGVSGLAIVWDGKVVESWQEWKS